MATRRFRPPPASLPARSPRKNSSRPAINRPRCCRRLPRRADMNPRDVVLVIDNYDSFTYNLVQYLGELGEEVVVYRNDEIDLAGIEQLKPSHIVISPGPCTPNEAGISLSLIDHFKGVIPIFGVCLGHQSIGQAFGGEVIRAEKL